jgi:hypothetical protein
MIPAIKRTSAKSAVLSEQVVCALCSKEMSLKGLHKHLASHQQQLALFALPLTLDETVDDEDDGERGPGVQELDDENVSDMSDDEHPELADDDYNLRDIIDVERASSPERDTSYKDDSLSVKGGEDVGREEQHDTPEAVIRKLLCLTEQSPGPLLEYATKYWGNHSVDEVEVSDDTTKQYNLNLNALQAASERGYEQVVKLLLDKGADVNAQGGRYGNALQAASERGNEQIVKLLLDKGADVNAQGGRYGNALQAASERGNEQIVKLLLDKGANVNAQGGRYGNALQAASERSNEQIVKLLLDKGADVNAQGGRYSNAL